MAETRPYVAATGMRMRSGRAADARRKRRVTRGGNRVRRPPSLLSAHRRIRRSQDFLQDGKSARSVQPTVLKLCTAFYPSDLPIAHSPHAIVHSQNLSIAHRIWMVLNPVCGNGDEIRHRLRPELDRKLTAANESLHESRILPTGRRVFTKNPGRLNALLLFETLLSVTPLKPRSDRFWDVLI
jgi:hypothetical protein